MRMGTLYISWDLFLLYLAAVSLLFGWAPFLAPREFRRSLRIVGTVALLISPLVHFGMWGGFGSPQRAARQFLGDLRKLRCAAAIERLSEKGKAEIAADAELHNYPPQMSRCGLLPRYAGLVPDSATLVFADDKSAVVRVSMAKGSDFLLPGFWPTKYTWHGRDLYLIRERNEWKVRTASDPESLAPGSDQ
jgi:hypothetical protein